MATHSSILPWRRKWQPTPVFLPGEGAWWATVHGVTKSQTQLSYYFTLKSKQSALGLRGFPAGSEGRASACNAGDLGSILGSGRSPGEVNGNPLQYSCLENPMDREAW